MDLWLYMLVAVGLIPVFRFLMADGCVRSAPRPGTNPLAAYVTADGRNPTGGPGADVEILSGRLEVHAPSGTTHAKAVPPGGIVAGEEFPVTAEHFDGATSPYRWSAHCTVEFRARGGPPNLVSSSRAEGSHAWYWDANRRAAVRFTLRMESDRRDPSPTTPSGEVVLVLIWRLEGDDE